MGSSTDQVTLRLPVTRTGRLLRRIVHLAARASGLRRRADRGWPRFEGGRPADADDPTIVLVHGFGVDGSTMLQLGRCLVGRHRVVVPDLPGFGEHGPPTSWAPEHPPGIEPFLEALDDLLDRLRIERPILVGSSMGGAIVAQFAATRTDRVSGLVLVGPAGIEPPVDSEVFAAAKRDEHMLKVVDRESFDHVYALNFVKPPWMPGWMRSTIGRESAPRAVEYEAVLRSLEPVLLGTPKDYTSIQCPTEIVWGAEDRIIDPSAGPLWADAIEGAVLTMIPETGHSTMVEDPRGVAEAVERVVRRVRS